MIQPLYGTGSQRLNLDLAQKRVLPIQAFSIHRKLTHH